MISLSQIWTNVALVNKNVIAMLTAATQWAHTSVHADQDLLVMGFSVKKVRIVRSFCLAFFKLSLKTKRDCHSSVRQRRRILIYAVDCPRAHS